MWTRSWPFRPQTASGRSPCHSRGSEWQPRPPAAGQPFDAPASGGGSGRGRGPGPDPDARSERDAAPHLALVGPAHLGILRDVADQLLRPAAAFAVHRRDPHLARVLDVDLGPGLLCDALDDLAARADDFADLVGVD